MATAEPPTQLTDLAEALRRRWRVVAVAALLGLLVGVVLSWVVPDRYEATTTVTVNPMNAGGSSTTDDLARSVSMPTEAGIATSATVAEAASRSLRSTDPLSASSIMDRTSVDSPDDSLLLRIRFSGDTEQQAAAGADAVAKAYLATRRADATAAVTRLQNAARDQIAAVQAAAAQPANASPLAQRSLGIQVDALGSKLAELGNTDLDPGQVVGDATASSSRSALGLGAFALAGLFIGLLAGIPVALLRKEENSAIEGVEGLHAIGEQIVLDGTKDTNRADTWDIAAFMLKIPTDIGTEDPFMIMVDGVDGPGQAIIPGQELVDALARRGRPARLVDAGLINEGKISRGWPTERKRLSWAGEIIVLDTTRLASDAHKVALAAGSDSVLLARTTTDDSNTLKRLVGLLRSKKIDIALTALFPPRLELAHLGR